jgi:hypothetical protein
MRAVADPFEPLLYQLRVTFERQLVTLGDFPERPDLG